MEEFSIALISKLLIKGGFYTLFTFSCLVIGILVFIHRKFSYPIDKYLKCKKLNEYLKTYHINSKEILPEADYIYLKTEYNNWNLQKISTKLETQFTPGVKIIEKHIVNSTLIILLDFNYKDFDLAASGKLSDIKKNRLMFGKFEFNQKTQLLTFKGEVFIDRFDKQRIEGFLRALKL